MAKPYLAQLNTIIERMNTPGNFRNALTIKHFFSGAAAYFDGAIFMSLSPVGLALKLCDEDCQALLTDGAQPLQYFPKAPVKKGYVVLPVHITEDRAALNGWILRSIRALT